MDKLFENMADDMGITPYYNESETSYLCRVVYSALGLWCLKSARGSSQEYNGISKESQSVLLHDLYENFVNIYPSIRSYLSGYKMDIAVFIRNLYEQTGYLLPSASNHNVLCTGVDSIHVNEKDYLCIGIPNGNYSMNGLGVHNNEFGRCVSLADFLVRDNLTPEEYILANYNICDFDKRDIEREELEFFDAKSPKPLSKSWQKVITSNYTVARREPYGPYYKVIFMDDREILFSPENRANDNKDSMIGAEFRRLYIALRRYYDRPMLALKCPIDNEYTQIQIKGQMPNREYYYFLLNGWPQKSVSNRNNYIMRNELVPQSMSISKQLGFEIKNGEYYG